MVRRTVALAGRGVIGNTPYAPVLRERYVRNKRAFPRPTTGAQTVPSFPGHELVTRFALAHRRLVVLGWVVLAVAGALTVSSTTSRLTHSFATPGSAGYDTNASMTKNFGIDGAEQPTIAVLHLRPTRA